MTSLSAWFLRPIERWRLHRARRAYLAQETACVLAALTGKLKYREGEHAGQSLSPDDKARIVAHHLHRGANPNARVVVPVKEEVFSMGPYRALRGKRSFLSICLQEPKVVAALIDAGAKFDQSALEMAVALYNWPYRRKSVYDKLGHPAPELPPSAVESLGIIASRGQIAADLAREFLDLHDRSVRPAHAILGPFLPALQSHHEAAALEDATPTPAAATPPQRL